MASRKISSARGGVAQMRVDVSQQGQKGGILLSWRRNLLGGFERLGIETFAEVGVGQVEFHIVGIGIGLQRRLEMWDGIVVQMIAGQQHADSGLRAIVAGADLIKLRDGLRASSSFPSFR